MRTKRREREVSREARRAQAAYAKVMAFEQCEACDYDLTSGEGTRSCNWGACPYLPEQLDVFCPTCNFDFFTGEGSATCGDPPRCEFAGRVAPKRVATVKAWLALHPGAASQDVLER